mgnify:CR=1 FL=1
MFWLWLPFFGTWWWIFTIVALLIIIGLEEAEEPGGAFGVLVLYAIVLVFLGEFGKVLSWIGDNPWRTAGTVLAYFTLEVPWASFWWWWKQSEKHNEYKEKRRAYFVDRGICTMDAYTDDMEIPDVHLADWQGKSYYRGNITLRAFWHEHKKALTCAMTWWPIHAGSFFFKDLLWNFWNRVLNAFHAIFDGIDKRVWGDVQSDFRQVESE